jgi:hypothetical protein
MRASWALTPPYFLVFAFLCGIVGFRIGWRLGRLALPLVQGALAWLAFLLTWSIVGAAWAAASVGAWALGTTAASVFVFLGNPHETDERVYQAAQYRASMLAWLETGRGPETKLLETLGRHLRETIVYAAAALATANYASLAMGAMLLNEMNAYVATLLRAAERMGRVLLLAWNLWSVVRVAAYVLIGTAAAAPLLRLAGVPTDVHSAQTLAAYGVIGLVVDLVLKLTLSRTCGRLIASAIDLDAAKANRPTERPLALHLE